MIRVNASSTGQCRVASTSGIFQSPPPPVRLKVFEAAVVDADAKIGYLVLVSSLLLLLLLVFLLLVNVKICVTKGVIICGI